MNICTSVNSLYVNYLYVMLYSLFTNNRIEDIRLFIFENDLTENDKDKLSGLAYSNHSEITFLHMEISDFEPFKDHLYGYTYETLFRLKLPELLAPKLKRILYLDVDIIVRKDIEELYDTDFDDCFFIACRDMYTGMDSARCSKFKRISKDYFNAGVMLWNLEKLRKYTLADFVKAAEEIDYYMPCADQDILNYKFYDRVKYVDSEMYNYIAAVDYDSERNYREIDPVILHFAGTNPWKSFHGSQAETEWYDYAAATPCYTEILEQIVNGLASKKDDFICNFEKIYELAFKLRCTNRFLNYNSDKKIIIYGAGRVEKILEELFEGTSFYKNVICVIDRVIEKDAFGAPVREKLEVYDNKNDIVVIVATIRKRILEEVKKKASERGYDMVISAYDFLDDMLMNMEKYK